MDCFGILFMFLFILKYLVVPVLVLIVGTVIYNKIKDKHSKVFNNVYKSILIIFSVTIVILFGYFIIKLIIG